MGREIKRVPLDFNWPLNEVWQGFLREGREFPPCTDCQHGHIETPLDRLFGRRGPESTGLSREAFAIDSTFYAHQIGGPLADVLCWGDKLGQAEVDMLVAEKRLGMHRLWDRIELPEPWEYDEGHPIRFRFERNDKPAPAAEEVNAANRKGGLFHDYVHDAINRWLLVKHRCQLLGIDMECKACKGRCVIADDDEWDAEEAASEAWQPIEPPAGDGWQLWETVSEGSPVSPVFATADELASWMSDPARGDQWVPPAVAAKFIADGWAPSLMGSPQTGIVSGVEWVGTQPSEEEVTR